MSFVETAINAAVFGHRGQVDKSGKPYIYHPLAVGIALEKDGWIDEVVAAGFLHDVVEDCSISLKQLKIWDIGDLAIPEATIVAVDHLTRRKSEETYDQYKIRCFQNPIAKIVKYYDSKHNLTRSENVTDINFLNFVQKRYGSTVESVEWDLRTFPAFWAKFKRPATLENTETYE